MAAVLGATALSVASSFSSSRSAKKEAKKAKALERLMTAEELRRLGIEQERVLGGARSQIAASGFTGYGASTESYLDELQREQALQTSFTAKVGAQRASAIDQRGGALASSYKMDALSSLFQGAGKAFNWGLD